MTDRTPAETLTAAATVLRDRAAAIDTMPPNQGAPWHVENCIDTAMNECPCIIAQGRHPVENGPATAQFYVADAETPEVASWIVLLQPHVGLALADLLDDAAEGDVHGEHNPYALAVARALLGDPA